MRVAQSVLDLIGETPIVRLQRVTAGIAATVLAKLEYFSPSGSVKDRIARYMVEEAERKGLLRPGSIIVEATTGNTGIAFAMVGAIKGYRTIIVMPEGMSDERKQIIRAYGAELLFTPGGESDVDKCIAKVRELAAQDPRVWVAGQFVNPDNVAVHREQTGREILEQTGGRVDVFVAGVGTGGTLTGVAQALKRANSQVRAVAVEPAECNILSGGRWGRHRIEGIGDGFVPAILDTKLVDEVIAVPDSEAIAMAQRLAREEAIFAGISSGANVAAAVQVARRLPPESTVVTMIPDSGQRYLSTDLCRFHAVSQTVPR